VTSTLVFEGAGRIGEYVGGYSDWQKEKQKSDDRTAARLEPAVKPTRSAPTNLPGGREASRKPRKLTPAERRELETLPAQIEKLEAEQSGLTAKLVDPSFFSREPVAARAAQTRLAAIETETATAFARWEELEALRTAPEA
jgi:ATP-binding cassette subfamily F protein uup